MNRRSTQIVMALGGWLATVALAGEAPSRTELPPAPNSAPDFRSAMPAALRPPQTDPATAMLVWNAVLERFPEIVDGPERDGVFIVAIALRADGSVVASGMRYVERSAGSLISESQRELTGSMPADSRQVLGGLESLQRKSAVIPGGQVLKGEVRLIARMVAGNWDEKRDSGIVQRAVLANHADLLLPMSGDHINQLTVVMDEDGKIARHKVQPLALERNGSRTRIEGTCGALLPGVRRELADSAIAEFAALGLEPDQTGLVGMLNITLPPDQAQRPPPRTIGADGIARGSSAGLEMRRLQVCYAWPRRPGEPVGGTPIAREPVAEGPGIAQQQLHRQVEQYFPDGSSPKGNWMLLTHEGQVIRTGHVELTNDELLTNVFVERMFPGIRVSSSMSTSRMVMPKVPGELPGDMINVTVMFLDADSPLPPPEDMPQAAE